MLGHVLTAMMSGKKNHSDPAFAKEVYKLVELADKPHVKPWERGHAQAVKYWAEG